MILLTEVISKAAITSGVASTFGVDDIPEDVQTTAISVLEGQVIPQVSCDARLAQREELVDMTSITPTTENGVTVYDLGDTSGEIVSVIVEHEILTRVSYTQLVTVYKDRKDVYALNSGATVAEDDTVSKTNNIIYLNTNKTPTIVKTVPIKIFSNTVGTTTTKYVDCLPCFDQYIIDLLAFRLAVIYQMSTAETCRQLCSISVNSCIRKTQTQMLVADARIGMQKLLSRGTNLR